MGGQSGLCTSFHDKHVIGCALVFLWSDLLVLWEALSKVDSQEQRPSNVTDERIMHSPGLCGVRTYQLFNSMPCFILNAPKMWSQCNIDLQPKAQL